jgi:pantothenate kinase
MPEQQSARAIELTVTEFVDRARALAERSPRTMLGITGTPGAGKSTLTAALAASLGDRVVVVPMDGFHLSNEILIEQGKRERKGAPDTFDVAGYVTLLRRIRQGETDVYAPRFDRDLEQSIGSAQHVPESTPLVVTEGNYLLTEEHGWGDVREHLDEVWYVDVELDEVRRRLIERRVGHGHARQAASDWVTSVDAPNAATVVASRERADLILSIVPSSTTSLGDSDVDSQ